MNRNQYEYDPMSDLTPDDLLPHANEHINALVASGEDFSAHGNMSAGMSRYARNIELGELIQSGEQAKAMLESYGARDETLAVELQPVIDKGDTALVQLLLNSTTLARYYAFGRPEHDDRERFYPRQRAFQIELANASAYDGDDFMQALLEKWYQYDLRKWEPKRGKLASFLQLRAGYNGLASNYSIGLPTTLGRGVLHSSRTNHLKAHETPIGTALGAIQMPAAPSFPSQLPLEWTEDASELIPEHDAVYDATPEFEQVENEVIAEELMAQLETARDKEIIRLYYNEDLTYEEIGQHLGGLTGARVGQLKRAAEQLMREYAREQGYIATDSSDLPEPDQV